MSELASTRRLLHGIAEGLLAGPQHRACGRIQLRVVPGGFATTGAPALRLAGSELVVAERRHVPLGSTFAELGQATGHGFGEPQGLYHDHSGVTEDELVAPDSAALAQLTDWFTTSDAALRELAPKETPVLWPEHFDVAVLLLEHSVGSSPGDSYSPTPYAYVADRSLPRDSYWNAPFGACLPCEQTPTVADLVTFWAEGLERLRAT